MARGELFILSAPSGAGKTTLIHRMFDRGLFAGGTIAFSVSHTTRAPRAGEEDGKAYHFVDAATFQGMVEGDRFLEHAVVHGNRYGTSYDEVLPRLEQGIDVVLDIDVQGATRVMSRHPEAHGIFIVPPSFEILCRRLNARALDEPDAIARRLHQSLAEIKCYEQYGYVIVNDDAERASELLAAIVLDKRQRLPRMRERVDDILRDFAQAQVGAA